MKTVNESHNKRPSHAEIMAAWLDDHHYHQSLQQQHENLWVSAMDTADAEQQ